MSETLTMERPLAHPIPLAALDDRLGFVGTAGSGKTYNAGTGVERILASGGRVVIPDPLGVWWGLGLSADGEKPAPWREKGKLVIFGGPHGDMPLTEHAGALIGETVASMAESAILDLSDLGTKASERRFMLAFLTALYRHVSRDPLHVIFDEADMWAPQTVRDKDGEANKLLGMMETVVRRGRIRGFIPWLISQRPAVLNKDVLSQVDGLVAFKLTSSQDRKAIGDWVSGQADQGEWPSISASLPTLPTGTGIVWLPTRSILTTAAFPKKATFDSSRTPARGERVERRDLKPLNLEALKSKLASLEEEQKANDPRALKNEIRRLNNALADALKAKPAPAPAPIATADEAALQKARDEGHLRGYRAAVAHIQAAVDDLAKTVGRARPQRPTPAPADFAPVPAEPAPIGGPQQRILNALGWWSAFGHERPLNEQVAFIAGYSHTSTGYTNPRGALKTAGLVEYPEPGRLSLTEAGRKEADVPEGAPTGEELRRRVMAKLPGPQQRILSTLIDAYPNGLTNEECASKAGYSHTSTGYTNPRGNLKTLNLAGYPSSGMVRASDWLFP